MTAPAETVLEVAGLSIEYRTRRGPLRAAVDVSFAVARAEVLGLVGESGSGKSTVARLIVGLYAPTSGTVSFPPVK